MLRKPPLSRRCADAARAAYCEDEDNHSQFGADSVNHEAPRMCHLSNRREPSNSKPCAYTNCDAAAVSAILVRDHKPRRG